MSHISKTTCLLVLSAIFSSCGGAPAATNVGNGAGTGGRSQGPGTGGRSEAPGTGGAGGTSSGVDGGGQDAGPEDGPGDAGCAQVGCHTPPVNVCDGADLKTYYDPNGTCSAGVCEYRFTTQTCPQGCQSGHCLTNTTSDGAITGDGPDCPGTGCSDAGQGTNLCAQIRCDSRPANECMGSTLKTYPDPVGTCTDGFCNYRFTTEECPHGCMNGACVQSTCVPGRAAFTADVTDVDSLQTTGTLPALAGGAAFEIRSYMQVKASYAGIRVPIYAPTHMTLYSSTHYRDPMHIGSDPDYQGEWGLNFQATCTTDVGFAHVREVVDKIAAVTVSNPDGGSSTSLVTRPVDFNAGEIIGYYIRGNGYYAWDFYVTDTAVTNAFVNPTRFEDGQLKFLHAICPYDLYPQTMRDRYLALLGGANDPPTAGRVCGTVAHDKRGTAAGLWFHLPYTQGTPTEARAASGNPMSIFKAETGPVYLADLDGKADQVGFLTVRVDPTNPTFRDPETITSSSSYCYERHANAASPVDVGWVYVKVVSDSELQVAYSEQGACPTSFPTTGVDTYYR